MILSDTEKYHKLAFTEKNHFLQFICGLGEKGLEKLFWFPGESFSFWWFSSIAGKPTLRSYSYERLISLLLSSDTAKTKKKPRLNEAFLYHLIKGLGYFLRFLFKTAYIKFYLKGFKVRCAKLPGQEYIISSYFPNIDKNAAQKGIFLNNYLNPFHKALEQSCPGKYTHILLQVYFDGYSFRDSVRLAKKFSERQSVFFIEEFFNITHIFKFAFYYVYFLLLFIFRMPWIKSKLSYEYGGRKFDVWGIFKNDFYSSFCGADLVSSLCYILMFKEFVNRLSSNVKILTICEMQPWEKALYVYAKKRKLMTIGVQHTIVPELLLQYFNAPQEITEDGLSGQYPLPDYLATVGKITADLFKRYGWPQKRVFIWGAQRFGSLKEMAKSAVSWSDKENYFVCAFSISRQEAEQTLFLLKEAFHDKPAYKIILKSHPSLKLEDIVNKTGFDIDNSVFAYGDYDLPDIMRHAKGLIVTESSVSLYALCSAIPIIVMRSNNKIDRNPLSYITGIPIYAYSAPELRATCDNIVLSAFSPVNGNELREVFEEYLSFPQADQEYLEKIKLLGGLK